MSRESLFKKARAAYDRAIEFDRRARMPAKYFAPVMSCERDNARRQLDSVVQRIMRDYPGEWSKTEQELLRPL